MSLFWILCLALVLDYFLGEPKRYHPLVGLGRYAELIEANLNRHSDTKRQQIILGFLALAIALIPFLFLAHFLAEADSSLFIACLEGIILYFTIGMQSLKKHAQDIYAAIQKNQLDLGRQRVAMIVSRDTEPMEKQDISRATVESVLENGNDAVFAAIFWFLLAGIPGVVGYRIVNTLDAMWGYKTKRYQWFGYATAKCDDYMNYIPARLTALSYALVGHWQWAIQCWQTQAQNWQGINPGVVMAAGSGALGVKLGGGDYYHGKYQHRPELGFGELAQEHHILDALKLLQRVLVLWILCLFIIL